jgi:hypothetical protein
MMGPANNASSSSMGGGGASTSARFASRRFGRGVGRSVGPGLGSRPMAGVPPFDDRSGDPEGAGRCPDSRWPPIARKPIRSRSVDRKGGLPGYHNREGNHRPGRPRPLESDRPISSSKHPLRTRPSEGSILPISSGITGRTGLTSPIAVPRLETDHTSQRSPKPVDDSEPTSCPRPPPPSGRPRCSSPSLGVRWRLARPER